jgi:hypothetical protein
MWGNICAFPHILGISSSYMTLQLLHSEFPLYEENLIFFIYQCRAVLGALKLATDKLLNIYCTVLYVCVSFILQCLINLIISTACCQVSFLVIALESRLLGTL